MGEINDFFFCFVLFSKNRIAYSSVKDVISARDEGMVPSRSFENRYLGRRLLGFDKKKKNEKRRKSESYSD